MAIEFRCTKCSKLLRTADDTAGKHAKCPECGEILLIPAARILPDAPPPPSSPFAGSGGFPPPPPSGPSGGSPFGAGEQPSYQPETGNPYQSPSQYATMPSMPAAAGEIRPTIIDLGDVMGRAWKIFKENWGMCLGAVIVAGLCNMAFGFVVNRIVDPFFGITIDFTRFRIEEFYRFMVYNQVKGFVAIFFTAWIFSGVCIVMLKIARGQPTGIGDVFSGGKYYVPILITSFIFQILIIIGSSLLFIPGFILTMIWHQYSCAIVDRNLGIGDSWNLFSAISKGNVLTLCLLGLLSFLLFLGGLITCGLGMLIVGPYLSLLNAFIYLSMSGQPTVDQMRAEMGMRQ